MGLIADIAGNGERLAPGLLHMAYAVFRVLFLVQVGDQHIGAFPRERNSHGLADPTVAAGDDGDPILELATAPVTGFAMVGARRHLVFGARHVLVLVRKLWLRMLGSRVTFNGLILCHLTSSSQQR